MGACLRPSCLCVWLPACGPPQAPSSASERNPLPALYAEVSALAACRGVQGVVRLLDFGYTLAPQPQLVVIMELAQGTLSQWRALVRGTVWGASRTGAGGPVRQASSLKHGCMGSRGGGRVCHAPSHPPNNSQRAGHEHTAPATPHFVVVVHAPASHALAVSRCSGGCLVCFCGSNPAPTRLHSWRWQRGPLQPRDVACYLRAFHSVVAAVRGMHDRGVVHFDLKPDNVLLRRLDLDAQSPQAHFDAAVAVGDFGEALCVPPPATAASTTLVSRGTESIMSPEMRVVAGASAGALAARDLDRRKPLGAGPASDVWSLGCLLFDLLVGAAAGAEPLFPAMEHGAAESHARAVGPGPVLTPAHVAALALLPPRRVPPVGAAAPASAAPPAASPALPLVDLVQCLLQRDISLRPDLHTVGHMVRACIEVWAE